MGENLNNSKKGDFGKFGTFGFLDFRKNGKIDYYYLLILIVLPINLRELLATAVILGMRA